LITRSFVSRRLRDTWWGRGSEDLQDAGEMCAACGKRQRILAPRSATHQVEQCLRVGLDSDKGHNI